MDGNKPEGERIAMLPDDKDELSELSQLSSSSMLTLPRQQSRVLVTEPLRSLIETGDVAGLERLIADETEAKAKKKAMAESDDHDQDDDVDRPPPPSSHPPLLPPPPPPPAPIIDLTQPYDDFQTPSLAFRAAELGHAELLRFMLTTGGVDPLARGLHGATLLHVCCRHGRAAAARLLLETDGGLWRGALIDAPDHLGWTPLHDAAMECRLDMVQLLARAGCDVGVRTLDSQTAEDLARTNDDGGGIGGGISGGISGGGKSSGKTSSSSGCSSGSSKSAGRRCADFLATAAAHGSYARWRAAGRLAWVRLRWLSERGRARPIYVYAADRVGLACFLFPAPPPPPPPYSSSNSSSDSSTLSMRPPLPRDLLELIIRFAVEEPA